MAVGRISGPLLKENLIRNGIDLAFETDLLYLDVNNQRIGVKTTAPQHELDVNGTTRTTNLIATNRADIADVTIEGNTISTTQPYLNLATLDSVVALNKIRIDSIDIEGNAITTNSSNANIELKPNGTGTVNVNSDMNVTGNVHATGNISADGNIVIGDQATDTVLFNAKVASDIIPDGTRTYSLGSDPDAGGAEWADVWVNNLVASSINSQDLQVDGVDLTLRHGNIYYVSVNGNDANSGDHLLDPFLTLKYALSQATAGDTVHVYPGVYEEEFPITIPVGVTVKGQGIRSVKIVPTLATQNNDAFLLNGETTIEDLTIADFYSPGYAFKFAPGFTVTTRSPYIRNVSVITKGSVTSVSDPRGFDEGDAGRGVYFDGSVATASSREASGLFHSVTFITPGVDAVTLTNGVRVEWLNSFTYFANRSIYAVDGASGIKGTGQTAIAVSNVTGSFSAGETVEYYDTDGVTLLESAVIDSIDSSGKIIFDGKQPGFETAEVRGGKTITSSGDAQLNTSVKKFGTASLALDGTGDYAFITSQDDFGFGTDDFTVEGWIYPDLSSGSVVLDFRIGAGDTAIALDLTTGGILRFYSNAGQQIIANNAVTGLAWNHFAIVRDSGTTTLYVNGTAQTSTYSDTNNYPGRPLVIGASYGGTAEFTGYIDDFRIIKGAAITPPPGGPSSSALVTPETVLMARFDGENASTTFEDDVIYAQDIRFSGGATATKITFTDFTDFGAEVRLIGSAAVYGNFGLVGDGPGVIMYAIGQNLAYIGNGKEESNNPSTVVQANEIVELNNSRIRYNSVDHKGDFRVGDLFYINQEDGTVDFSVSNFTINTADGVTFVTGGETTFVDGSKIETGDWRISGNTLQTLTQDANFEAGTGEINLNSNVNISGSLDVTGNVTIGGNITIGDEETDTIEIIAGIDSDIIPKVGSTYSLGTSAKTWSNLFINQVNVDNIVIRDNFIETTESNSDLELRANGTGEILVPSNNVQIDNDLNVDGVTNLADVNVNGTITHTGDYTQTGTTDVIGNVTVTQDLDVTGAAQFEEILIDDNYITTTTSNADLELRANGTGNIFIPNNNVEVSNNLTVDNDITANNITVSDTITSDIFTTGNIVINDNYIETTESNSDLDLRANGTGRIYIPTNDVVIENNLDVTGTTTLADTSIVGNITQTGNVTQTGNIDLTGDVSVTGDVTVSSAAQFENIRIENNFITTTLSSSNLELRATQFGNIVIPSNDVVISNDLTVVGTISVGDVTSLGTITANRFSTGDILIDDNFITTTNSNSNLELRANGTGEILVPSNNVQIDNNLTVNGVTNLKNTNIIGDITHVGNVTQTGNINLTGNLDVTGEINISASVIQFEQIQLAGNLIQTTESNTDLELRANGTGRIFIPSNDVVIENNLTVNGTISVGNITSTGTITANSFSTGDILIDDNFITTTTSNSDLELRANGTGSIIIDSFDINDTTISSSSDFNITPGSGILNVNATGAMKLPTGTDAQRPTPIAGYLRYNTDRNRFEGYNGTNWVNLKGVEDLDGNTRVTAELTEGANDGIIRFDIQGSTIVSVDSTKLTAPRIDVDDIRIDGNVVSTTSLNTDLELTANGTGSVVFDNFAIKGNTITNTVTNSITTFDNTANGYVKFTGSYGIVIPSGASGERPPLEFTETGQVRFNTDDSRVEIWDGQNWVSVAGAASGITRNDAEEIALSTVLVLG